MPVAASKKLFVRQVPAWLAARGIVGPSGRPLGISTIYDLIYSGRLPVVRLGRTYVEEHVLEEMIRSKAVERKGQDVRVTEHRTKRQEDKEIQERLAACDAFLRQRGINV